MSQKKVLVEPESLDGWKNFLCKSYLNWTELNWIIFSIVRYSLAKRMTLLLHLSLKIVQ